MKPKKPKRPTKAEIVKLEREALSVLDSWRFSTQQNGFNGAGLFVTTKLYAAASRLREARAAK